MKQNRLLIHLSKKGTNQVNKTTNVKCQNDAVILGVLFQYNKYRQMVNKSKHDFYKA